MAIKVSIYIGTILTIHVDLERIIIKRKDTYQSMNKKMNKIKNKKAAHIL